MRAHWVTVLADTAERAEDLDEAAAIQAKEEAERAIADSAGAGQHDIAEAQAQLAMAQAQLQALAKLRKNLRR